MVYQLISKKYSGVISKGHLPNVLYILWKRVNVTVEQKRGIITLLPKKAKMDYFLKIEDP